MGSPPVGLPEYGVRLAEALGLGMPGGQAPGIKESCHVNGVNTAIS